MKSQILIDQSVSGWVRPADRTVLREGGSSPLRVALKSQHMFVVGVKPFLFHFFGSVYYNKGDLEMTIDCVRTIEISDIKHAKCTWLIV